MSIITRAAIAASLVVIAATAAQAQGGGEYVTTYIGGPKSGLTQTIRRPDAQAAPVRQRVYAPRVGVSGGANAIGVDGADYAYAKELRVRPRANASRIGFSGGANAIGVDEAD